MDVKRCRKCGELRPVDMFSQISSSLYCKVCQLECKTLVSKTLAKALARFDAAQQVLTSGLKVCSECGETKPIEMFTGNGREKDGFNKRCKACVSAMYEKTKQEKSKATRRQSSEAHGNEKQHPTTKGFAKALARIEAARQLIVSDMKTCSQCGEAKPVELFSRNTRQTDGLNHRCKACNRMKHELKEKRRLYISSIEDARALEKAHRESKKAYRKLTKEVMQRQAEERREAKRLFAIGKQSAYQRRRAWIIANGGSHTKAEIKALIEAQNHQCAYCSRCVKLTKDHIIPVSKGGSDYISNICMACRRCNLQKRARTPAQWIKRWYLQPPYVP